MRMSVMAGMVIAGVASLPAAAQYYDPQASRAENTIGSINRSITSQQQNRGAAAQSQFETNAIRGQLSQPTSPGLTPPPVTGPAFRR